MSITTSNDGRFKPGHPGGPGRPKGSKSLATELRNFLDGEESSVSRRQLLARKVWELAMGGDMRAITLIYDRLDGKVPEDAGTKDNDAAIAIRSFLFGQIGPPVEAPGAG